MLWTSVNLSFGADFMIFGSDLGSHLVSLGTHLVVFFGGGGGGWEHLELI